MPRKSHKSDAPLAQKSSADDSPAIRELSIEQILRALIDESVRSRLRHRALLGMLVDGNVIELKQYVTVYQSEEDASFAPLLDMLLMDTPDFSRLHGKWLKQERERLGYTAQAHRGVALTPMPPGSARSSSHEPERTTPQGRKSRRKKS